MNGRTIAEMNTAADMVRDAVERAYEAGFNAARTTGRLAERARIVAVLRAVAPSMPQESGYRVQAIAKELEEGTL